MDRLIFGDNQFFGVNHASEDKARAQSIQFQDLSAVIDVLKMAQDEGIRAFMCTTHERVAEFCEYVRTHPADFPGMAFYPCMPYAHKYANAVTELGMLGAVQRFLPDGGIVGTLMRGASSVVTRDVAGMASLLVDSEMKMFRGLETPVIFLQNVVVDLLLGLRAPQLLSSFADHIRKEYDAEPGFITMNLPMLLEALDVVGVENPIVCANINKAGFRMSGGISAYLNAIQNTKCRVIAMSVFASGAIPAAEAIEWISGVPNVSSIVFGASSRSNIRSTRELVDARFRQ